MVYDGFQPPSGIEWGNADRTYGMVKYGDESQQVVLFYTKSVFDPVKSKATRTRQYINQAFVKMHPAGERLNVIDRPVKEEDKHRFPAQWNAFLQNRTQVPEGTPIDLLFPNNPAVADNLKAMNVYTIQQLAKLSSNAIDTIGMGARDWINKAVQYLDSAQSGAAFLELRSEVEKKDQEIKLLRRQVEKLIEQVNDFNYRISNPNANSMQPGWAEGVDAQAERIDANHPSQEARPGRRGKKSPHKDALEQAEIIKQVTEESIPVIDVTKME